MGCGHSTPDDVASHAPSAPHEPPMPENNDIHAADTTTIATTIATSAALAAKSRDGSVSVVTEGHVGVLCHFHGTAVRARSAAAAADAAAGAAASEANKAAPRCQEPFSVLPHSTPRTVPCLGASPLSLWSENDERPFGHAYQVNPFQADSAAVSAAFVDSGARANLTPLQRYVVDTAASGGQKGQPQAPPRPSTPASLAAAPHAISPLLRLNLAGVPESGHTFAAFPDSSAVVSGGADGKVKVWDTLTHQLVQCLQSHTRTVWYVEVSPDCKTIASCSKDATAKLWDVATGTLRHTLSGHLDTVWTIVFSPDSAYVATGACDLAVKLWSVADGTCLGTLHRHTHWINTVLLFPAPAFLLPPATAHSVSTLSGVADDSQSPRNLRKDAAAREPGVFAPWYHHQPPQRASPRSAAGTPPATSTAARNLAAAATVDVGRSPDALMSESSVSAGGPAALGDELDLLSNAAAPSPVRLPTRPAAGAPPSRGGMADASPFRHSTAGGVAMPPPPLFVASAGSDHSIQLWNASAVICNGLRSRGGPSPPTSACGSDAAHASLAPPMLPTGSFGSHPAPGCGATPSTSTTGAHHPTSSLSRTATASALLPADSFRSDRATPIPTGATPCAPPAQFAPPLPPTPPTVQPQPQSQPQPQEEVSPTNSPPATPTTAALGGGGAPAFPPGARAGSHEAQQQQARAVAASAPYHLHTLEGHTLDIYCLAWSPTQSLLVSGGKDKVVRMWYFVPASAAAGGATPAAATGLRNSPTMVPPAGAHGGFAIRTKALRPPDASTAGTIWSVNFAPNGRLLASAGADKLVRVWDTEALAQLHCFKGHEKIITRTQFLYDGRAVVSGGFDGTLRYWDLTDAQAHACRRGLDAAVNTMCLNPALTQLAVGTADGAVSLWNPWTGALDDRFSAHSLGPVTHLRYAPSGDLFVTTGVDKCIKVWSPKGALVRTIATPGPRVNFAGVSFTPGGMWCIVATREGAVVSLRAADGTVAATVRDVKTPAPLTCVSCTADGKAIVAGAEDGRLRAWRCGEPQATPFRAKAHDAAVTAVCAPPCGTAMATAAADGTVCVWAIPGGRAPSPKDRKADPHDPASWRRVRVLKLAATVRALSFVASRAALVAACADGTAYLCDTTMHRQGSSYAVPGDVDAKSGTAPLFVGHKDAVTCVAVSPAATVIATGSADRTVRLYHPPGVRVMQACLGHTKPISAVAIAPDAACVATGSEDCTVRLWRRAADVGLQPYSTKFPFRGHNAAIASLEFNPTGAVLTSRAVDGSTAAWDVPTGRRMSDSTTLGTLPLLPVAAAPAAALLARPVEASPTAPLRPKPQTAAGVGKTPLLPGAAVRPASSGSSSNPCGLSTASTHRPSSSGAG